MPSTNLEAWKAVAVEDVENRSKLTTLEYVESYNESNTGSSGPNDRLDALAESVRERARLLAALSSGADQDQA